MHRILILAPTFFPDPSVAGIRVTQWARYLPEFGWKPLILCRHHGHTATPELLAQELHPNVEIEYLGPRVSPASEPAAKGSLKSRLKKQLAIPLVESVAVPDALVWKWKRLGRQAIEIANRSKPDVVVSSGPPHSIHVVGRAVARATGAAWVADFRDPYLIDSRYGPNGFKRLFAWRHHAFEHAVYRDAQLAIHAIPLHGRWASRRYPFARGRIRILTNGIPAELLDEQFLQSARNHDALGSARLSIRAVGVLGKGAVETIGAALGDLLNKGIDAEFRHVGRAADAGDTIPAELRDRLLLSGSVPHREALREIAGADILLKYDDQERAKAILLSSKLFEYLATGRPIIAVNPTRADWQLIGRLSWCWCLEDPRPTEIAAAIQQAITTGAKPPEAWLNTFRQQYNRRNQTGQLVHWLDELVR